MHVAAVLIGNAQPAVVLHVTKAALFERIPVWEKIGIATNLPIDGLPEICGFDEKALI